MAALCDSNTPNKPSHPKPNKHEQRRNQGYGSTIAAISISWWLRSRVLELSVLEALALCPCLPYRKALLMLADVSLQRVQSSLCLLTGGARRADDSFETVSVDRIYIYLAMGRLRPKDGLISMKDLQVRWIPGSPPTGASSQRYGHQ